MALKCWDGYDHYNSVTDLEQRSSFIQYQRPNTGTPTFVTGRNGFGKALQFSSFISGSNHGLYCSYGGSRNPNNFFGMAIKQAQNVGMIFTFFDSITLTPQCSAFFNPTNYAVQLYRGQYDPGSGGGTFLGASPNNVWFPGTWNYFELWPVINNSTGGIKVYFNNNLVCDLSGLDTQVTANAWWDQWELTGSDNNQTLTLDDHYVGDTTIGPGIAPCDSPIGDAKVSTLWATGDNSVAWSPKTIGQPNYTEIDEIAMDSDTSYNYTTTPTARDMFAFQSLPAGVANVFGVQLCGAYRKDDALVRTIQQLVQSGATVDTTAVTHNVPDTTYAYFTDLFILNPDTSLNWSVAEVNGMAAGYQLVA